MRAVVADGAGGPEVLTVVERPDPEPGPGEVVLDVAAAGLNRADLLQRMGFYPPPPGAVGRPRAWSAAARSSAVGRRRRRLAGRRRRLRPAVGRRVRHQGRAARRPADARAGRRRPGHRGRAARGRVHRVVQRLHGRRSASRGDAARARRCRRHRHVRDPARRGVRRPGVHHRRHRPRSATWSASLGRRGGDRLPRGGLRRGGAASTPDGAGVDVILDNMGASYLERNVDALATKGRLVIIGMQGGTKAELDINALLRKRGRDHRHHPAGPARRGEGRDLRGRRRARVAAGGRRLGARRRCTRRCRWTGSADGARPDGVAASTAGRSCSPT